MLFYRLYRYKRAVEPEMIVKDLSSLLMVGSAFTSKELFKLYHLLITVHEHALIDSYYWNMYVIPQIALSLL